MTRNEKVVFLLVLLFGPACDMNTTEPAAANLSPRQAESALMQFARQIPLYHTYLIEPQLEGMAVSLASSCDEDGTITGTVRHPADGEWHTVYNVSPDIVHLEIFTRIGKPDSTHVSVIEGTGICQHVPAFAIENKRRSYENEPEGSFWNDSSTVMHSATYADGEWHGRWYGAFRYSIMQGPDAGATGECTVALMGTGIVEWAKEGETVTYTGTVCGHEIRVAVDVTAGGLAQCGSAPLERIIALLPDELQWEPSACPGTLLVSVEQTDAEPLLDAESLDVYLSGTPIYSGEQHYSGYGPHEVQMLPGTVEVSTDAQFEMYVPVPEWLAISTADSDCIDGTVWQTDALHAAGCSVAIRTDETADVAFLLERAPMGTVFVDVDDETDSPPDSVRVIVTGRRFARRPVLTGHGTHEFGFLAPDTILVRVIRDGGYPRLEVDVADENCLPETIQSAIANCRIAVSVGSEISVTFTIRQIQ